MRKGLNPNKDEKVVFDEYLHQVIIPVYIPNNQDYFKDSFTIFQYSLESLFKTCHAKTFFTIINNGCSEEVSRFIDDLYAAGQIHEIIHTYNNGKVNAILKGIVGQNFPLITITDADVLFVTNWQNETYNVFNAFSKTGAVSPTPSSRVLKYYTFNVILNNFFSKKLRFTDVVNPKAMQEFAKSINDNSFYNKHHLEKILTISNGNFKAAVGAGHFVATYRKEVFDFIHKKYAEHTLGGISEGVFLDQPVAYNGFWRLSTEDNFAYHMGNVAEPWMSQQLKALQKVDAIIEVKKAKSTKPFALIKFLKENFFDRVLIKPYFWIWFLRFKGLSKEASKHYK